MQPQQQPAADAGIARPLVSLRRAERLLTEAELRDMPDPAWLVEGYVQAGSFSVLYGPPEVFKTFIVEALAGAVTTGRPWFGATVRQTGPAVYVPADDQVGHKRRWFAWRADAASDVDSVPMFTWPHELNLYNGRGFDELLCEVRRVRPVLLVLDTWARVLAGGDENQQKDVGAAIALVDALRREGVAVFAIHHVGVNGTRERGSSVLGAAADTMFAIVREGDAVSVSCAKQRNGPPFSTLQLVFDPEALVLRPVGVGLVPSLPKQQQIVLDALRHLVTTGGHHNGASAKAWQGRACGVEGVKPRTFFHNKRLLLDAGAVEESGNDRFRPRG